MKPRQLTLVLVLLLAVGNISEVSAQGWLKQLGKKAEEAAKQKVEEKVQEKTRKAVDKTFDEVEDLATQKKQKKSNAPIVEPADTGTPADNTSDWDNKDPYYALKKGAVITYTMYNGKGKVQGYNKSEVLDISRTKNSIKATISGQITDSKGRVQNGGTVSMRAQNGNFYVNLLDFISPQGLEGVDFEADMSGNDMVIPTKLKPGQTLPDANATFKMKMKSGTENMDIPPLVFHIFNRRAIRAEIVDTPVGQFVCFKIIQTVEAEYPIIGTQQGTTITWIGKGLGVIKTEHYDAKGKLTSKMLLTGIE